MLVPCQSCSSRMARRECLLGTQHISVRRHLHESTRSRAGALPRIQSAGETVHTTSGTGTCVLARSLHVFGLLIAGSRSRNDDRARRCFRESIRDSR